MLELTVQSSLPKINGNFKDLKVQLLNELKKYDLIVDADSTKTAKKMATTINKLKGEIATLRKSKTQELSAPIKEFEIQAKELESLCEESRQKLLSQTKVFEDKERDRALELLTVLKSEIEAKYGIKEGFEIEVPFDLAIISNLTKSGLSKKAKDEVDARVLVKKQFQEKIDTRLLTLEAICYKGGLQVPLTRENINHFLMEADDDVYLKKLVSLIKNEISRLEKAEQLKAEQLKRKEAVNKERNVVESKASNCQVIAEIKDNQAHQTVSVPNQYSHFKNLEEFAPIRKRSSKKTYVVTATFEVEVDEKIEPQLVQMLVDRFAKAKFKQVPTVYVERKEEVA